MREKIKFEVKKCIVCGKEIEFVVGKRGGDYHRYSKRKYCSQKCSNEKFKKDAFKNRKVIVWRKERQCKRCNEMFTPKAPIQKLCDRCGKKGWLKLRFEVFKRDNFTCQYCGRNVKDDKIKIHCDHVLPKNKGGKNTYKNLVTACEECNLGKSDVLLDERKFGIVL
jgi:5-methylcytosine-specific restriction endonuclease McrA